MEIMLNFPNYTTADSSLPNSISCFHFEASPFATGTAAKVVAITGIVLVILSSLLLYAMPIGSTGFYLACVQAFLGVALFFASLMADKLRLKTLPLPNAESVEEYLQLLDCDQENKYSYTIHDLLAYHQAHTQPDTDLDFQTRRDLHSSTIYTYNGRPYPLENTEFPSRLKQIVSDQSIYADILELTTLQPDPILLRRSIQCLLSFFKFDEVLSLYTSCRAASVEQIVDHSVFILINQALLADVFGVLKGRYNNEALNIHLGMPDHSSHSPCASMRINVIKEGNCTFLEMEQIFQIHFLNLSDSTPIYVKGCLFVDLQKGSGKVIWKSPQTAEPTL